ncbi:MAG: YciI family protein [Alloacidobacterium sp.]
MQYILMDYVNESGWPKLTRAEKEHWLGAYRAYMEAMLKAGILKTSNGLGSTESAATVRVVNNQTQVLDGPYADTKEQLGGFHIIEAPDLDAAIAWAARSPTALHGVVEVRLLREGTLLTTDIADFIRQSEPSGPSRH